jgi:hypothetical protein
VATEKGQEVSAGGRNVVLMSSYISKFWIYCSFYKSAEGLSTDADQLTSSRGRGDSRAFVPEFQHNPHLDDMA